MFVIFFYSYSFAFLTWLLLVGYVPEKLSTSVFIYGVSDFLISWAVTIYLILKSKNFIRFGTTYFENFILRLKSNSIIVIIAYIYIIYLAYNSYNLIIAGYARHVLLSEYNTAGLDYLFLSSVVKFVTALILFLKTSVKMKVLSLLALFLVLVITASRSELGYVLSLYILLFMFSSFRIQLKKFVPFVLVSILLVTAAIGSTIYLQGRPIAEGFNAFIDIFKKLIDYRSYAYLLADLKFFDLDWYNVLFPFFGFVSEALLGKIVYFPNRIDTEFVSELHYLGTSELTGHSMLANVLYPWWYFFVSIFGPAGLIIKALFLMMLLTFCIKNQLYFVFWLLCLYSLIGNSSPHPLITLSHNMNFLVALFLDVFCRFKIVSWKLYRVY